MTIGEIHERLLKCKSLMDEIRADVDDMSSHESFVFGCAYGELERIITLVERHIEASKT